MTSEQARAILELYHHGVEPTDEEREALAIVEEDRELAQWYEQEQTFDQAVREKLAELTPPAHLLEDLQALKHRQTSQAFSIRRALALAAIFTLLAIVAFGFLRPPSTGKYSLSDFRQDMVRLVDKLEPGSVNPGAWPDIQASLRSQSAPLPVGLERLLGETEPIGCRVEVWNDREVSMICFQTPDDEMLHLFVVMRDVLSERDVNQMQKLVKEGGYPTRCWEKGGQLYLLVGGGPEVAVPGFG